MRACLRADARVGEAEAVGGGPVAGQAVERIGLGQVELAHAAHAVVVVAQPLVVGGGRAGQVRVVLQGAQVSGLKAGGQGDPGRGADRAVGGDLRETHAPLGKPIDVRRAHSVRPGTAEVVEAVLVVHDQQDVRPIRWGGSHVGTPWRAGARRVTVPAGAFSSTTTPRTPAISRPTGTANWRMRCGAMARRVVAGHHFQHFREPRDRPGNPDAVLDRVGLGRQNRAPALRTAVFDSILYGKSQESKHRSGSSRCDNRSNASCDSAACLVGSRRRPHGEQ